MRKREKDVWMAKRPFLFGIGIKNRFSVYLPGVVKPYDT